MDIGTLIAVISILGVIIFSFSFWRILKEDYISNQIFSATFYILLSFTTSLIVVRLFEVSFIWVTGLFIFFALFIASKRTGIRYYELLDGFVRSFLTSLIPCVILFLEMKDLSFQIFFIVSMLSLILFYLIKYYYKSFIWYKSGKRGFSGLFTIGVFYLIRSVTSIIIPEATFLLDEYDIVISGLISFVSFLNIFILAKG